MNRTVDYYNENAKTFAEATRDVKFDHMQNLFACAVRDSFPQVLQPCVLDFGCGSGRDAKYFVEQGFLVDAIDGSEKMVEVATEFSSVPVQQMDFMDFAYVDKYHGIWACASLLHLEKEKLPEILQRLVLALVDGGVLYASFKYGDFNGYRQGRHFTDLNETGYQQITENLNGFRTEKVWITGDARPSRENEKWLNLLIRKVTEGEE